MTDNYRFPDKMRPATLPQRLQFYSREFRIGSVNRWFQGWKRPLVFAIIIGRHTKVFPEKYRDDRDRTILIDNYDTLNDLQRYCEEYRPESLYYDRNVYKSWEDAREGSRDITKLGWRFGQQLAFDIDPENFECPIHGSLDNKMNKHQGLSFCRLELQLARDQTVSLLDELSRQFEEIRVVCSGRGFHVHVLDEDTLFWSRKKRLALVRSLTREGYRMDEWVAGGNMRLIRLPYSLNGLVSRVVTPVDRNEFPDIDPVDDPRFVPGFARK
jgi:DNA primase catalytic subunit